MYVRQGRGSRKSNRWVSVVIVLLFITGLVIGGYFFLSEYLVFTADGMRITLFDPKTPPVPPETEPKVPPITIEKPTDGSSGDNNSGTTPDNFTSQPPATAVLNANLVDLAQIDVAALTAQGIKQVAVTIKSRDGIVHIPLATPVGEGSIAPNAQANGEILRQLDRAGIEVVAVVSAFRDAIAPRAQRDAAIQTQDRYTWLDRENISWYDPKNEKSTQYVGEIVNSLAALGVDRVILTEFCYPFVGKTNLIGTAYRPDSAALATAVTTVKQALTTPIPVLVALRAEAETLTGQNTAALAAVADGLVVTQQQAQAIGPQLDAGVSLVIMENGVVKTFE